jgi:hypothetical protein
LRAKLKISKSLQTDCAVFHGEHADIILVQFYQTNFKMHFEKFKEIVLALTKF